jgi:DNA-binding NtrC family response regulator
VSWGEIMPAPRPLVKVRVLLVDDEALICRTIERLLKKHSQFEVRAVTDYKLATYVFNTEGPFDIVLTDLRLEGISGIELAQRLTSIKPDIKVIFMSGDISSEVALTHLTIEKPFDKETLIATLEAALPPPPGELE